MRLYQLYDTTAETTLGPIMAFKADAPAIRQFTEILQLKDTQPNKYPEDFQLLFLGDQDEDTGAIFGAKQPVILATGKQWKDSQPDDDQLSLVPRTA